MDNTISQDLQQWQKSLKNHSPKKKFLTKFPETCQNSHNLTFSFHLWMDCSGDDSQGKMRLTEKILEITPKNYRKLKYKFIVFTKKRTNFQK